jgi:hypothetical protein
MVAVAVDGDGDGDRGRGRGRSSSGSDNKNNENGRNCKGITQTLIPNTSTVRPKVSQSTDGNLLWPVVYISDTVCLHAGAADDLLTS